MAGIWIFASSLAFHRPPSSSVRITKTARNIASAAFCKRTRAGDGAGERSGSRDDAKSALHLHSDRHTG